MKTLCFLCGRRTWETLIASGIVILCICIATALVVSLRARANMLRCQDNLRQLWLGVENYHDTLGVFPCGTATTLSLNPNDRLSWQATILPYIESSDARLDHSRPWNHRVQYPHITVNWPWFRCPSSDYNSSNGAPAITHYIGLSGLGTDSALLEVSNARTGFFGYDRLIRMADIRGGRSNTILVLESEKDIGPWASGGSATVRGLDGLSLPYLGSRNQFGGLHPSMIKTDQCQAITNAAMTDGSVRAIVNSIDPRVLEVLATLADD